MIRIRFHSSRVSRLCATAALVLFAAPAFPVERLDPDVIGAASDATPTVTEDGVVRIGWSRGDVEVTVDGFNLPAAAGLGSWAAFTSMGDHAMVMGDTVVFQDEVDAAMDAALAHDLEITALHNHFFYDSPKVYFMHIGGEGEARSLAAAVKAVWNAIRAVRAERPVPATGFGGTAPQNGDLNATGLSKIVGQPATAVWPQAAMAGKRPTATAGAWAAGEAW